ncbi:putative Cytochrome P450 18a1 [Hypsibius exemplaris]|uniref:Cytochrome P450 18a1 n=1 Tax=Hypsibius exemplaris TaxID=2072580 RepID=A0A1W0X1I6_HYPEX|nr:putative Cytochrome P450 18a1 [Hypsibius exemplaris]
MSLKDLERFLDIVSPYVYPSVAVFVSLLCVAAAWLVFYRWQYRQYPPGPPGIPVLGYLPFLPKSMAGFSKLCDIYGPVVHMKLGAGNDAVFLGSLEAVKEAFVDNAEIFSGRGDVCFTRKLWNGDSGILMAEGAKWQALRSFAVDALKMEDFHHALQREIVEMIGFLKTDHGKALDCRTFIMQGIANVAASWTLGPRFAYVDKTFHAYVKNFQTVADLMHHSSFEALQPSLNPFSDKNLRVKFLEEKFKEKIDLIHELIRSSRASNANENFASAFISHGLANVEEAAWFTEQQLVMVVNDIWGAATEASTSTLQWAIYYMLKYPAIQRQVQAELDEKTGFPEYHTLTVDDLREKELPYTTATLQEVERCGSVAPIGVPRSNTEATLLFGSLIPSRSLIIPNLWRIHHDPENWDRPGDFNPERFITPSSGKVFRPATLVPYSLGSRACPFQTAAASQLLLVFANLLRCFDITLPAGATLPAEKDFVSALTLRPNDFSAVWTPRFANLLPQTVHSRGA